MNKLSRQKRMTDTAKGTVLKLLRDLGTVCAEYQDEHLQDLSCNVFECDEIWSFCYAKQKNLRDEYKRTFSHYAMLQKIYGADPGTAEAVQPGQVYRDRPLRRSRGTRTRSGSAPATSSGRI